MNRLRNQLLVTACRRLRERSSVSATPRGAGSNHRTRLGDPARRTSRIRRVARIRHVPPATAAAIALLAVVLASIVPLQHAHADAMRTHTEPGAGDYDVPFWPGASYRSDVQSPSEFLGWQLGSRCIRQDEVERYYGYLDATFPNATLVKMGETYEGRALYYLIVTSEENARSIDDIRDKTAKLADPRTLGKADDAKAIIETNPAVAWMAYGIHGDETSSVDAAVFLAYQLLAGEDAVTERLRSELVVLIDPIENPDGRARWLTQLEMWNAVTPNNDAQGMNHGGMWPWGRTNHYLFDMNRDWFALVHPESRARTSSILKWNPVFLLDCHEMGSYDTYLFSPPREPFNPHMISQIREWWDRFAADQAAAFDQYGWDYYTREWNEEFYPGYGSSWGIYIGAIGMLYEQARTAGSQVKRPDGTVMTYRETVHHQFISSMANLTTIADNRQELLQNYYDEKKRAVAGTTSKRGPKNAAWVLPPPKNAGRFERFAETLQMQSIEVERATKAFKLRNAKKRDGSQAKSVELPEGSMIIRSNQPLKALIDVILTFDIRIENAFLETEKRKRLKNNSSRLYETTAWSLPLAYNLECYFVENAPGVDTEPYQAPAKLGGVVGGTPKYGYAIDTADDRAYVLLGLLFEHDYKMWAAREPFRVDDRVFDRGSVVIRRSSNPDLDESELDALARETGVVVYGVNTALGTDLADLGGGEFRLLQRPRIGLFGGPNVSSYGMGAIWHMLDARYGYRTTVLNILSVGRLDLRKYNVLILPHSASTGALKNLLGESGIEKLKTWVKDGGTLIATGSGASFIADKSTEMGSVRLMRQVLEEKNQYDSWLEWSKAAEAPDVDSLDVWEGKKKDEKDEKDKEPKPVDAKLEALKEIDAIARRLQPQGPIVAADLDEEHWLAYGELSPVPVMLYTADAFVSKQGVQVAARFAGEDTFRMAGLLWPEARARWAETAYATREGMGSGQIILFAYHPNFRGFFHGGERLLMNAICLGPGFGARAPVEW